MRVQQQRLTPGMQRGDDARTGAQILLVAEQLVKRLVHRGKQQLCHRGNVGQPEVIQLMRHGENDMVMVTGQQPGLLAHQPALDLEPGTLGTQPMATGVVPHPFDMPLRTGLDVAT
jgi:hypothetical protein